MHIELSTTTCASSWLSRRTGLLLGAMALLASTAASATFDYNRPHDYYPAKAEGAVTVVDLYHLGPCEKLLGERDYQRGMNECAFILKIFPNHPTALLLMADICSQWKSPKCQMEDVLARAVAINPRAAETFVVEGIYRHRVQQYAQAIQSYTHALELQPNMMNAHYNIALSYLETKQFDLANQHAQRAYSLGATLPGLRDRLIKAGYWKPLPQDASQATAPASGMAAPAKSPEK